MTQQCVYTASAGFVWAEFVNPQVDTLQPLHADNADFRDFGDRDTLAKLGVFSIDRAGHRCLRRLQALREQEIADAYEWLGIDRRATYRVVAQEVQADGLVPEGCWARSTGTFARRRDEEDEAALRLADRVRAAADLHFDVASDPITAANFSLEA